MQRMHQQKLSCILASVKVSLFLKLFFVFVFTSLSYHCNALECRAVGVGPTHVQWLLINPNTQRKIIKCVFTCCAWLGRRDTNTERTATHCKYLSPSTGSAPKIKSKLRHFHINGGMCITKMYQSGCRWQTCVYYSSKLMEYCRNTHRVTPPPPPCVMAGSVPLPFIAFFVPCPVFAIGHCVGLITVPYTGLPIPLVTNLWHATCSSVCVLLVVYEHTCLMFSICLCLCVYAHVCARDPLAGLFPFRLCGFLSEATWYPDPPLRVLLKQLSAHSIAHRLRKAFYPALCSLF